jgi:RNA polymerase primary sigma factor
MTTGASADQGHEDLFVADFYPLLGEYLSERHASRYDAGAGRARFLAWLSQHADDGEPVEDYLRQVSQVPELSAEHEAELARRIEAGRYAGKKLAGGGRALSVDARSGLEWIAEDGMRARNQLIEANLRLVVSLANRYSGRGMLVPDLVQAGSLGLTRAVEKFDPTKGYTFSVYATWWIRQAITRALADPGKRRR